MATEPQTIDDVSQNMGVQQEKQPAPLYANPNMVYSTSNIQKASVSPQKAPDYAGMSVDNLAKEIAKAQNVSDLEQINISNQPIRQGVITGQSAYAQKLADYRLGALGRLYSAKEMELQRENEAKAEETKYRDLAMEYGIDSSGSIKDIKKKLTDAMGSEKELERRIKEKSLQAGEASKLTQAELYQADKQDVFGEINSLSEQYRQGDPNWDGYLDPYDYNRLKASWSIYQDPAKFDETYQGYINPRDIKSGSINLTLSSSELLKKK